jgi:hypothetical protein
MTASEANHQRVLSFLSTEREEILEQFRYIDVVSRSVRPGVPPMSENRKLLFYDRRDRIQLDEF